MLQGLCVCIRAFLVVVTSLALQIVSAQEHRLFVTLVTARKTGLGRKGNPAPVLPVVPIAVKKHCFVLRRVLALIVTNPVVPTVIVLQRNSPPAKRSAMATRFATNKQRTRINLLFLSLLLLLLRLFFPVSYLLFFLLTCSLCCLMRLPLCLVFH